MGEVLILNVEHSSREDALFLFLFSFFFFFFLVCLFFVVAFSTKQ